jgi:Ca2+-binding EF-hand superfamily protein
MKKLVLLSALLLGLSTAVVASDHEKSGNHGEKPRQKEGMFKKMDADGDGVVTKAEADAYHNKKFAEKDVNKDGKITKEELEAYKEKKREERKKKAE